MSFFMLCIASVLSVMCCDLCHHPAQWDPGAPGLWKEPRLHRL